MKPQKLHALFSGTVILPGDDGYDKARQPFYGGIDKKPAAIIQVASTEDIKKGSFAGKGASAGDCR